MPSNFKNLCSKDKDYVIIFCYIFHLGNDLNLMTKQEQAAFKYNIQRMLEKFVRNHPDTNIQVDKALLLLDDIQAEQSGAITKLTEYITSDSLLIEKFKKISHL